MAPSISPPAAFVPTLRGSGKACMTSTPKSTMDSTLTKQCTLLIRLSMEKLVFSVFNPLETETVPPVEKETDAALPMTANLRNAFREIDFLKQPYKKVCIVVEDKRFTTAPMELFDEKEAETMFHYNLPPLGNEIVLHNLLRKNSLAVLFGMDQSAYNFLLERHPEAHFYSHMAPLIVHHADKSRLGNCRKMYAYVRAEAIDLLCFEHDKLLLCNSLPCTESPDRLYFLLYTWKQAEFDQERDELILTSQTDDRKTLADDLKRFVRHVLVANPLSDDDLQSSLKICE